MIHLESWYAQSHPDEDFAETFAVWLTPGSDWRARYEGWPALKKLEYVDELMRELAGRPALASRHQTLDPLQRLRKTLRTHYKRKRQHYAVDRGGTYDRELRRLFSDAPEHAGNLTAVQFLTRIRRPTRRLVAEHRLGAEDLIYPVFVHDAPSGTAPVPVPSMPGVQRYTTTVCMKAIKEGGMVTAGL